MKKGALLIVTNSQGKILLQQKDSSAPTHPNKWTLFGGGIEDGETPAQAVHREFIEELEWNVQDFKHFKAYKENDAFYVKTNKSADELRRKQHEGLGLGYFSEKEIKKLDIAKPHLKIIKDYLANRPMTVHFICRGNAFRSVIAEAYLKSLRLKNVEVISSGSVAGKFSTVNEKRHKAIVRLIASKGAGDYIKPNPYEQLTQTKIDNSDVIVCMNDKVFGPPSDKFKLPKSTKTWDVTDVGEKGREETSPEMIRKYINDVYDEITSNIDEMVKRPPFNRRRVNKTKKILIAAICLALILAGAYIIFLLNYPRFVNRTVTEKPITALAPEDNRNIITIPAAKIQADIQTGGAEVLDQGLAWHRYPERGSPETGGNFIISGHRYVWSINPETVRKHSIFFFLDKVKVGDTVNVHWDGEDYEYVVTELKQVQPNSTDIEKATAEPQLTIYTCTLGGSADGRVVVIAKPLAN